jgi:hypothetical protein
VSTSYGPVPEQQREPDDSPVAEDWAPSGPRRPSILHLVVGLVFLGLAAVWALAASGQVSSDDTWVIPGLLVVAGATGLVAALVASVRSRHR